MNRLEGHISGLEVSGSLTMVQIALGGDSMLKAIVIETPLTASYLEEGRKIGVMFKETAVVLGSLEAHRISLLNRLNGHIKDLEKGVLLSRVWIDTAAGAIQAVLSTEAAEHLGLAKGSAVCAMVKANELMLSE